ncbi:MAG: Asp-tRNA(Asn)/Glu-tRNA(Gln) amidotransferase subunit GatC [Helicobacteraceae bacterium]|jgi:aspartyl-tRNA(Asn)/glutamyl-tRNA(Gln) amidotransferase subunit C|nr:Asp-tRNA(Asn)/Glu-tRNA(Gln) amidotransferase subunit GatC [Helicobacteraceae bacterium]
MQIDDKLLTHLENLAQLTIAGDKRAEMERDLTDILGFVEKLSELETDHIDAISTIGDFPARLRADQPYEESEVFESIISHAPSKDERYFVVPRVVS